MSIADVTPMKRRPTHPGEIPREDFMPDCGLTVSGLAKTLGVSRNAESGDGPADVISTLRAVLEVPDVAQLRYSAGAFDGTPVSLPGLGLDVVGT